MVLTGLLFVSVTGIVRYLGPDIPAVQAAFLRYGLGVALLAPVYIRILRSPPGGRTLALHAGRGFMHSFAVWLWFFAMARISIAQVTAINYSAPIFVAIGAALFLGERLFIRRIAGIAAGFLGMLIIVRPGFSQVSSGQIAMMVAAPMFATSFILAKKLTDSEDSWAIVAMLSLFVSLFLLPSALLAWQPTDVETVAWLALMAVFATAGHYTMMRAFACAPITVTQPATFLQLVWATLLGMAVFDEPADPWVLAGGGIIVAAITYISHREAVAARRAMTPPAPAAMD